MDRAAVVAGLLCLVAVAVMLLRRRRSRLLGRVDVRELGLDGAGEVGVVGFSSPYCLPCQAWEAALSDRGVPFREVDLSKRPDLAHRYRISATPLILAVRVADGEVLAAYDRDPRPGEVERIASLTG
jgi:hypothetical protein